MVWTKGIAEVNVASIDGIGEFVGAVVAEANNSGVAIGVSVDGEDGCAGPAAQLHNKKHAKSAIPNWRKRRQL